MTDLSAAERAANRRDPAVAEDQQGAEARFRRAYLEHYRAILAYALRRGVEHGAAEEIVAETFTVLWRRMGEAPETQMLLPWLYAVAARILANQRRTAARRERLFARLQNVAPHTVEGESYALERLEVRVVVDALQQLSAGEQEMLVLAAWEGLSHREIGAVLGCSENAAAIRLHRARKRLSELTRKEDAESRHREGERASDNCGEVGEN
jgi:RNA polymerase sigma-70 factor (ECF subfamily)